VHGVLLKHHNMEEVEMRNLRDSKGNTRSRHHKKVTAHLHPKGRTLRGRAPQTMRAKPHSAQRVPEIERKRMAAIKAGVIGTSNVDRYLANKQLDLLTTRSGDLTNFNPDIHTMSIAEPDGAFGRIGLTLDGKKRSMARPETDWTKSSQNPNRHRKLGHTYMKAAGKYGPTGGTPTPIVSKKGQFARAEDVYGNILFNVGPDYNRRKQNQVRLAKAGRSPPESMAPIRVWKKERDAYGNPVRVKNPWYDKVYGERSTTDAIHIASPAEYNQRIRQGATHKQLVDAFREGDPATGLEVRPYYLDKYSMQREGPTQPSVRDIGFAWKGAQSAVTYELGRLRQGLPLSPFRRKTVFWFE